MPRAGSTVEIDGQQYKNIGSYKVYDFNVGDLIGDRGYYRITVSKPSPNGEDHWYLEWVNVHNPDGAPSVFDNGSGAQDWRWVPDPYIIKEMELP